MSFTDQRLKQNTQDTRRAPSDYLKDYLLGDLVLKLDAISDKFVIHLYEDIASTISPFDFKLFLKGDYHNANEEAGACVRISYIAQKMFPKNIKFWTDAALKCFDHFLIIYVQDIRKEKIRKSTSKLKERDVYDHLITIGGDVQEIGQAFTTIYQYRNEFQHVQVEDKEGRRSIRRVTNSFLSLRKALILEEFEKAFKYFPVLLKN